MGKEECVCTHVLQHSGRQFPLPCLGDVYRTIFVAAVPLSQHRTAGTTGEHLHLRMSNPHNPCNLPSRKAVKHLPILSSETTLCSPGGTTGSCSSAAWEWARPTVLLWPSRALQSPPLSLHAEDSTFTRLLRCAACVTDCLSTGYWLLLAVQVY